MARKEPRLGDLVVFVSSPQPGEFGIVVEINNEFANVMWSWGTIECSLKTFEGERWGNLRIITDEN
jgi:hypothetical protein